MFLASVICEGFLDRDEGLVQLAFERPRRRDFRRKGFQEFQEAEASAQQNHACMKQMVRRGLAS